MSDCIRSNFEMLTQRYGLVLSPDQAAEAVAAAVDGDALLEQVSRGRFPVKPKPTRPRGFVAFDLARYLCGEYSREVEAGEAPKATAGKPATRKRKGAVSRTSVAERVKARREALGIAAQFVSRKVKGWSARQAVRERLKRQKRIAADKVAASIERQAGIVEELNAAALARLEALLLTRKHSK